MTLKNECSQWVFECFEDWKKNPSRNHVYDKVTAEFLVDVIFTKIGGKIDSMKFLMELNDSQEGYNEAMNDVQGILK